MITDTLRSDKFEFHLGGIFTSGILDVFVLDHMRQEIYKVNGKYHSALSFAHNYKISSTIFNNISKYINANPKYKNLKINAFGENLIRKYIKAYIARICFGEEGYQQVINQEEGLNIRIQLALIRQRVPKLQKIMFQSIVSKFNSILFSHYYGYNFPFRLITWQAFKTLITTCHHEQKHHFYTYWSVSIFFVILVILRPFFHVEQTGNPVFGVIQAFGFILIFSKLVIAVPLFLEDIFRFFEWIVGLFSHKESEQLFHSRRKFISITGIGLGSLPFAGLTYGILKGAHDYK
ncbi:MAG: hypothetical protein LC127_12825, partial [Chitinophagales bacterium]|nr:hypothetical protein [Chitinophagales bacterium]